jgi:hypothetical protein
MTTTILDSNKIEDILKELTSAQDIDNDAIVTKVIDTLTTAQIPPVPVPDLNSNVQSSASCSHSTHTTSSSSTEWSKKKKASLDNRPR